MDFGKFFSILAPKINFIKEYFPMNWTIGLVQRHWNLKYHMAAGVNCFKNALNWSNIWVTIAKTLKNGSTIHLKLNFPA